MRGRVWWGKYLRKRFQRLQCDWMKSHLTRKLAGSDSDYAGSVSEVCTEGKFYNYLQYRQHGVTNYQYTCRKRRLKVVSLIYLIQL